MISGGVRKIIVVVVLVVCGIPATSQANEKSFLPELFSALSAHPQNKVQYEEIKHVSYLEQPLTSSGNLIYQPPDTIIREQAHPNKAVFMVNGSEISMQTGSQKKVMGIDKVPMMRAFRQAASGMLEGNLAKVTEFAHLTLKGVMGEWELLLKPKNEAMAKVVRSIIYRGRHGAITEIEINELSGDWSVMKLSSQPTVGDEQ